MTDVSIHAAIRDAFGRPFSWGEADCALSVADVLAELGHGDLAAGFRGRYASREGAAELLRGGLADIAGGLLIAAGWRDLDGETWRAGDVGFIPAGPLGALAINDGAGWVAKSPGGLVRFRMARRAWGLR